MYYLHLIPLLAVLIPCLEARYLSNTAKTCIDSSFRSGLCKTVENCPGIMEDYYDATRKSAHGIDYQTFINKSVCGSDGRNILICCRTATSYSHAVGQPSKFDASMKHPLQRVDQSNQFRFSPLGGSKPSNSHETTVIFRPTPPTKGQKLIPQTTARPYIVSGIPKRPAKIPSRPRNCGLFTGTIDRVVGGSEARRGNYPWIAALIYGNPDDSSSLQFRCGGSLISPTYVLTAAHCIKKNLALVRLGAHNLTNMNEINARNYGVKRMKAHENFSWENYSNDVALIELNATVDMTKFIRPICLPYEPNFFVDEFVDMRPFVAGWGSDQYLGPSSDVLRDVSVPIIDRGVCKKSYESAYEQVRIDKTVICAGNSLYDSCQGDSGGPLMMPQVFDNSLNYYVLGVVSFGYECSREGYPGVYTRVPAYLQWIYENMP